MIGEDAYKKNENAIFNNEGKCDENSQDLDQKAVVIRKPLISKTNQEKKSLVC